MNNLVEFPNREIKIDELIKIAEQNKDLDRLEHLLKEKYQINKDQKTNIKLVKLLFSKSLYNDCLTYIKEFEDAFIKDSNLAQIYLECLLNEYDFEKANWLLENTFYQLDNSSQLREQYNVQLDEYIKQLEDEREAISRALYSLSHYSDEEQIYYASKSSLLNKEELVKSSRLVFKNPYVTQIAKTALTESMIQHKIKDIFEFSLFNELFTIDLSSVNHLLDDPIYHKMINKISDDLANEPSYIKIISNEVQYDLMIIFPLHQHIINNVDEWLQYYYDSYSINNTHATVKASKQFEYYQKLQLYKNK